MKVPLIKEWYIYTVKNVLNSFLFFNCKNQASLNRVACINALLHDYIKWKHIKFRQNETFLFEIDMNKTS